MENITLKEVPYPQLDNSAIHINLTDQTMQNRKERLLTLMKKEKIDTLVLYNDLEHGSNFAYLTGFITRFEEGLLIIHQSGEAFLVLGNENIKLAPFSRIKATLVHTPFFSLPNQPMKGEQSLAKIFRTAGIKKETRVGIVGWKLFTSQYENNRHLFDVPHYLVEAIKEVVQNDRKVENRTDLFIHPNYGVRVVNNANEIAHYEFGSSLASDCVLKAIQHIEIGKTEMEIADFLVKYGQTPNVIPIVATGERFQKAVIYPTNKTIKRGDKMSITTSFTGGLASRSGYAVSTAKELPNQQKDYINKVVKPYYQAIITWLEHIEIGMSGQELYALIEKVLPQELYHWHLNPGHLTADEEWMSSPVNAHSTIQLQSGMLFQIDIIPSISGYAGASCENGVALANDALRQEIQTDYPELWKRIERRKQYIKNVLGITLPDCVLPLSSGVGFYNPFFLNKKIALVKQ